MKKYLWIMLFIVFMESLSMGTVVMAEETEDVKIDERSFPDEHLRKAVYIAADRNRDYILQKAEIDKTKTIGISGMYEDEDEDYFSEVNLKGIEIFKNLENICVATEQIKNKKNKIINFDILYQLKNLKSIDICGDYTVRKYDFSRFPKLEKLSLKKIGQSNIIKISNKRLKSLKIIDVKSKSLLIKNTGKVKKIKIQLLKTNDLDLSNMKALKSIDADDLLVNKLKFGRLKRLKKISIVCFDENVNKSIKKINLSGLRNLENIQVWGLNNIKNIKFGKINKLKSIDIRSENKWNKNLKFLDVSNLKGLKVLIIKRMSKLNKIKICKNQKFKYFITENCKKLKQLDMKNCRVSKAFCIDKWTKVTNLNPIAKKHLKYN